MAPTETPAAGGDGSEQSQQETLLRSSGIYRGVSTRPQTILGQVKREPLCSLLGEGPQEETFCHLDHQVPSLSDQRTHMGHPPGGWGGQGRGTSRGSSG